MAPLYQQIHGQLRRRIETSFYSRGAALPAESKLVEEFGVSLITVRRALHELALDGLVESRQGVGHFVRMPQAQPLVIGLSTFTSDVVSNRLRIIRTLLVDEMIPAQQEIAEKLDVQPGSMLRHLMRLDAEGNMPISTDEVFIQPALAQKVTMQMAADPSFMVQWQLATGIVLHTMRQEISVEMPGEKDQLNLQIGPGIPVLVTNELSFDSDDRPKMYIVTRYRADRCHLSGTFTLVQTEMDGMMVGVD